MIEKGILHVLNLAKVCLTVDQLEMQLRQANVKKIEDVEWGTIEPNGRVGFYSKKKCTTSYSRRSGDANVKFINPVIL
ncbi:YetF domain-containing protein [Sporomusa ovata]|uniref:YetF domain-containing protein n=1 Tax=Sporomusa ovata TaxID=2378 RepID=UPI003D15629B